MVSERDVVGLLHRADWTKLTLTGTVRGDDPVINTVVTVRSDEPLSGPWRRGEDNPTVPPPPPAGVFGHGPPWVFERMQEQVRRGHDGAGPSWNFQSDGGDTACILSVAPGRRFRADIADGSWAVGCDGTRVWHWFRDRLAGAFAEFDDRPGPPYRALLAPSWLLTGYALTVDSEVTVAGRAGIRVRGTLRMVASQTPRIGGRLGRSVGGGRRFAPIPRWVSTEHHDEVEAVVDAELGILLRCSHRNGDAPPRVTEFLSVDVPGPAIDGGFSAPPGSVFGGDKGFWPAGPGDRDRPAGGTGGTSFGDALGEALGTAGKEAAKTAAGIAAGGLGALIRYAPRRPPVDPFKQATAEDEDPEAAMPMDEPPPEGPGDGPASGPGDEVLPDKVLHLVHRSGTTVRPFSAALHQWFDAGAVFAAVPPSARGAGFGGIGFLADALRDRAQQTAAGASHGMSTVRMGSWTEYRIDVVRSVPDAAFFRSGRPNPNEVQAIASDGTRVWRVLAEQVLTGPAAPPPGDLAELVDASWLLDRDLVLSGGTETWLGGRRGYRIVAWYREGAWPLTGLWDRLFFPAVAVVDAETGLVLRLTRFKGGRPAIRQELRDVTALDAGAGFGFTPPAGRPVHDVESLRDEDRPGTWSWSWHPPQ